MSPDTKTMPKLKAGTHENLASFCTLFEDVDSESDRSSLDEINSNLSDNLNSDIMNSWIIGFDEFLDHVPEISHTPSPGFATDPFFEGNDTAIDCKEFFKPIDSYSNFDFELNEDTSDTQSNSIQSTIASTCSDDDTPLIKVSMSKKNIIHSTHQMFIFSCEYGNYALVKLLLKQSYINPSYSDCEALLSACRNGHCDIITLLLNDSRIDPTVRNQQCLLEAAKNNHLNALRLLLDDPRIDPSLDNCKLFRFACEHGLVEVVLLLQVDLRIDPAILSNYGYRVACDKLHLEVVAALLEDYRVDPNCHNHSVMKMVCYRGDIALFNMLMASSRLDIKDIKRELCTIAEINGHHVIAQKLDSGWTLADLCKQYQDTKVRDRKRIELLATDIVDTPTKKMIYKNGH